MLFSIHFGPYLCAHDVAQNSSSNIYPMRFLLSGSQSTSISGFRFHMEVDCVPA